MSTSAATLDASASQIADKTEQKAYFSFDLSLNYLIPTITAVALGILCIPNFGLGLVAGAIYYSLMTPLGHLLDSFHLIHEDPHNEYGQQISKSIMESVLFVPIAEEGIFRGIIQPLLTQSIQILIPGTAAIAFGPFSVATTVSVLVSGVFFGAIHYSNPHKNSHLQAGIVSVSGIVWGILAAQFGIGASIAAHVANNSIGLLSGLRVKPSIEFVTPL